jgi:hypothetical protein
MRRARLAVAVLALLALVSCATAAGNTAKLDVFNGLKTIRVGVEGAVAVFNVGYQAGTYSEAQRTQLGLLYQKYLLADKAAADALMATSTSDPGEIVSRVTVVAADVIRFIQALK